MRKTKAKTKRKTKTHFEQIPLEALEKLRLRELAEKKPTGPVRSTMVDNSATKTQPYSVPILLDATRR